VFAAVVVRAAVARFNLGPSSVRGLPGPAEDRFERLVKIVRQWLPVGWTSMKQVSPDGRERTFLAQDGMTGTLVTLALTRTSRVYLLVKRTPI
jgi:hypothetical protein